MNKILVYVSADDDLLEYCTIFSNSVGNFMVVPDSLYSDFKNSHWFYLYPYEMEEVDDEETI